MSFFRRRLVFAASVAVGGLIFVLVAIGLVNGLVQWQYRPNLVREVKFVRNRGLPLSTFELNDYYRGDPSKTDITAEFERILAVAENDELRQMAQSLPIVGKGESPPEPHEQWEQLAEVKTFLKRHQELLQFLEMLPEKNATARFKCDLSMVPDADRPNMEHQINCMRLLSLQFRVDLFELRAQAAVDRIVQQMALAEVSGNIPDSPFQLCRLIIVRTALRDIEHALNQFDLSDSDLVRLRSSLLRFDAQASLAQSINADRAFGYSMCAMPMDALAEYEHELSSEEVRRRVAVGPEQPDDAAHLLSFHRRMTVACERSIFSVLHEADAIETEVKELIKSRKHEFIYTGIMAPAMLFPCRFFAREDAHCQSAIAALAAMRFRRVTGKWPENLDELVPQYLERVPIDAYSGKTLRCLADMNTFKVYGLGENRKDDGGTWDEEERLDEGFTVSWRRP